MKVSSKNHLFPEAECPRLPRTEGMTVPLVTSNHVMPQLMLDIKVSQLASWTTSNFLYDDSVGKLCQFGGTARSELNTLRSC
jgi:hypothetical protein